MPPTCADRIADRPRHYDQLPRSLRIRRERQHREEPDQSMIARLTGLVVVWKLATRARIWPHDTAGVSVVDESLAAASHEGCCYGAFAPHACSSRFRPAGSVQVGHLHVAQGCFACTWGRWPRP